MAGCISLLCSSNMEKLNLLLLLLFSSSTSSQQFISAHWQADSSSIRSARYNRQFQNPGSPCSPSPCGQNTECMVNNQGNPICSCISGYVPKQSPVDGCCPPEQNLGSPVILQNRLGAGPSHLSIGARQQSDPCSPTPCGPGTTCSVNRDGNPECRCQSGYTPNPDTITGCKPECTIDPDCRMGFVCRSNNCAKKPDPCQPNPCGPGARCSVNSAGNAICQCEAGLIPKPDTITGCGPECSRDPDCQRGFVCQNQRCIEKPDPCDPSPCGPGAQCSVTGNGNAICRCQPGLIPNPDTISGCKPECIRDPDCQSGYVCQSQRCVERPDPCFPSPCGPGAACTVNFGGNPICRCEPGLIPKPDTITGCGPECIRDPECDQGFVCQSQRCVVRPDPCNPSPCGPNTRCMENNLGNPICRCLPGYLPMPDTISGCKRECEIDPDCRAGYICQSYQCVVKPDPCDPSPCGPNTECSITSSGNPICRCLPTYIPKPDTITGCGRECETDRECSGDYICQNYQCVPRPDPCQPTPCGPNTECNANRQGNPVCTCLPGYSPQPDTITGCSRIEARTPPPDPCSPSPCGRNTRCEVNRLGNPVCQCIPGYIPMPDTITGCVEEPDPCDPNPCGPGADCRAQGRQAVCQCPAGYKGDPYAFCKRGDCEYDRECSSSLACFDYNCRDPCIGTCGRNANCEVRDHRPICSCPQGFTGDPLSSCDRRIVVGGRQTAPPRSEPRQSIVIGQQYTQLQQEPVSRSVVGGRYNQQVEEPRPRHVVGSRYSSSGGSSSCGSGCQGQGRSAPSSVVVVGSGGRKKRDLRALAAIFQLTKFFATVGR